MTDRARQHGATPQTDEVTDELVRAAATGDRQAVTTLLQTIQPPVVRYCRAKLAGSPAANHADDAAQETCIAVLKSLPTYRFTGRPFGAFVYRVASNKCTDVHRERSRGLPLIEADPADALADQAAPDTADGPLDEAETLAEIRALLDHLTPHQREIVTLRITEDLTGPEIAAQLGDGTTPGAVRVALHRGIATLRRILAREEVA